MNPEEVIQLLHHTPLMINGKPFEPHPNGAQRYVQYMRRFDGGIHYEVFRGGGDYVYVRLDDERPNVGDEDKLRSSLITRAQECGFDVCGRINLMIHRSSVDCRNRQFDDIKSEVEKRMQELYNAFEPIL